MGKIVITGASSDIGLAIARRLSASGKPLLLQYRSHADRLAGLPLGKAAPDYLIPCGRLLASRPTTTEVGARRLKGAIRDNPASPLAPNAQFALADAWLSYQAGIVFGPSAQDLADTFGFGISADDRIDLPLFYRIGHIPGKLIQHRGRTGAAASRSLHDHLQIFRELFI